MCRRRKGLAKHFAVMAVQLARTWKGNYKTLGLFLEWSNIKNNFTKV